MCSPDPILVVDDHPDGRDMLVEYLEFKGFNVHEAANGAAALVLASTLQPRVILLDHARSRRLRNDAPPAGEREHEGRDHPEAVRLDYARRLH